VLAWMLGLVRTAVPVDPGDRRQVTLCRTMGEDVPRVVAAMSCELVDEMERVASVVPPGEVRLLEGDRKRFEVVALAHSRVVVVMRVVDDGGVGADQHEMVRRRGAGDLGEVAVAEREPMGEVEVAGDLRLPVLHEMGGV